MFAHILIMIIEHGILPCVFHDYFRKEMVYIMAKAKDNRKVVVSDAMAKAKKFKSLKDAVKNFTDASGKELTAVREKAETAYSIKANETFKEKADNIKAWIASVNLINQADFAAASSYIEEFIDGAVAKTSDDDPNATWRHDLSFFTTYDRYYTAEYDWDWYNAHQ